MKVILIVLAIQHIYSYRFSIIDLHYEPTNPLAEKPTYSAFNYEYPFFHFRVGNNVICGFAILFYFNTPNPICANHRMFIYDVE